MTKHPVIIVPGWQNSEPGHWQSLWQKELGAIRVEQNDWNTPQRDNWLEKIESICRKQKRPPFLICHSMGTNSAVILSDETNIEIAGAFLVAPVDLELESTPKELVNFLPTPLAPLRFPGFALISENDPYCSFEKARDFCEAWEIEYENLGKVGHINLDAGFGEFPKGLELLNQFIAQIDKKVL